MTTFLLVRHASCAHVGRSLPGRRAGVHLNDVGRAEAARLAELLARAPLAALHSSPLERARETAAPLADRLGLAVQVSAALNEVDVGEWSGKSFAELEGEPLWGPWNAFRSGVRPPGGESALEVALRVTDEMQALRRERPDGWVALFSHADVIRTTLAHLAGMPLDLLLRLEVEPASVSTVVLEEWGPRIVGVNRGLTDPWDR